MESPIGLGKFRLYPLLDGFFRLDGGPIFGVVPKPLWSRIYKPDERNRIRLAMRPLLLEAHNTWILIDTGIGDKFDAKLNDIYGVERTPRLEDQLSSIGITPSDIRIVINTHLHWDHAGGNTHRGPSGNWSPSFPNARYIVQKGEFEFATKLNERTRGSYRPEDYESLHRQGYFDLADGDVQVSEGVRVVRSGGHVPHHQCVLLQSEKQQAFYLGDLIPTHAHLPLPYIMGYDLDPLTTLSRKKEYLSRAMDDEWLLFFCHDPDVAFGKLEKTENQQYRLEEKS